jgi:hypothetical protein
VRDGPGFTCLVAWRFCQQARASEKVHGVFSVNNCRMNRHNVTLGNVTMKSFDLICKFKIQCSAARFDELLVKLGYHFYEMTTT